MPTLDHTAVMQHLQTLVRLRTLTEQTDTMRQGFDYLADQLQTLPFRIEEYAVDRPGQPPALSRLWLPKHELPVEERVILYFHMDVVDGDPALFDTRVDGDLVRGRGVFDMKFAPALYIEVLRSLAQSRGSLPNIALMAVGDEESGGVYSSRYLLNTVRDLHGAVAILPDGGTNWHIVRESKGLLHLAIDIHGVSGHASRPWKGINAIDRAAQMVQAIRQLYPEPSAATWDTTVTFSQIESGSPSERNKIPGTAMLFLDIRYPNEVPPETIISRIERTARTVDPGAAVRRVVTKAPFLLTQAPLIERWKELIQGKQSGGIYIQEEGTADHVYFAEHSIPAIVTAPRGGDAHSDTEWIDIGSMMEYGEVLYEFLAQNAK